MNHRNTRNSHMVAEQEFRTTTPEPASPDNNSSGTIGTGHGCCRADTQTVSRTTVEQVTTSVSHSPRVPCCCTEEMLENATLAAPFGKEDTAAELQSHAARTQDTLVNAVENAEVTEIKRAVFRALTRLRAAEMKEFDTIARLETQITNENNENFRHETVSHEFRTALQQSCMTKKKGKDARRAGAVNAARRAGETVETKTETACLLPRKRTSRSTLLSTALVSLSRCRKHGSRS